MCESVSLSVHVQGTVRVCAVPGPGLFVTVLGGWTVRDKTTRTPCLLSLARVGCVWCCKIHRARARGVCGKEVITEQAL